MGLFKTITGLAESAIGSVSNFREMLEFNPGSLPFLMPPQVELGLAAARAASDVLGLDLKVPSGDDLKAIATGKLDLILGGVRREANTVLDDAQEVVSSAEEAINSIEWLL